MRRGMSSSRFPRLTLFSMDEARSLKSLWYVISTVYFRSEHIRLTHATAHRDASADLAVSSR